MKRTAKTVQDALGELTQARDAAALKAKNEGFDKLTAEERAAISGYAAAVEPLNEELAALSAAEEVVARTAKVNGGAREGLSPAEARDFKKLSIVRGLQLLAENKPLDGIEAEVHQIAQREASRNGVALEGFGVPAFIGNERGQTVTGQTTTAGDQGGVAVETEVNGLLSALWESSFLSQVGARRLAGLQGTPRFIVEATKNTPQELTETQEMSEDEILMSEFTMLPTRRGTAIPVSKQTLLQASIDVQQLVQDNITKGLDRKLNQDAVTALLAAIISGNGNLLALGTNGADPTYAHMVALETLVSNANAIGARNAYLLNTKTKGKLALTQKFSGTNGAPVYGDDNTVYGYPAVVSNLVPSNLTKGTATSVCSAGIFGNFADLYVGMWGGMDFIVDTVTQAKKGNVLVVANMYWQVKVARAASFAGFKDATTVIS
jgi:HK97 family phage major capsid protein